MECKYGKYYLAKFTRVNIDKDLNTTVNIFNIDQVAPELIK